MYRYRYINKHIQFGCASYTLVLEDLEGDMTIPTIRIEKTFNIDPELIDDDFLYNEARKDILMAVSQQEHEAVIPEKNLESEVEES